MLGNRKAALKEYETLKRLGAHQRAGVLKEQMDRKGPGDPPQN